MIDDVSSGHAVEGTVVIEEASIFYVSVGDGPAVVVVHGGPGLGYAYLRPDMDRLARVGRLIYYDQRGAGRSAPIAAEQMTLARHIRDLEGLRDALGVRRWSVVGHSIGALVALLYASRYSDRVASLVLANTAPPFLAEFGEPFEAELKRRRTPEDRQRLGELEASPGVRARDPETLEEYIRTLYLPFLRDRRTATGLRFGFTSTTAEHVLEAEEATLRDLPDQDPEGSLGRIVSPTLVVHGAREAAAPGWPSWLAGKIPGARLAIVEDGDHFAYLEDPDPFFEAVLPFLREHAR